MRRGRWFVTIAAHARPLAAQALPSVGKDSTRASQAGDFADAVGCTARASFAPRVGDDDVLSLAHGLLPEQHSPLSAEAFPCKMK
jgi:hypothetical protein